jgi:hypothetical protein
LKNFGAKKTFSFLRRTVKALIFGNGNKRLQREALNPLGAFIFDPSGKSIS